MDTDKRSPSHADEQREMDNQQASNNGLDSRGPRTLSAKARPSHRTTFDPDCISSSKHLSAYLFPSTRHTSLPVLRRKAAVTVGSDGSAINYWNRGYCNSYIIAKGHLDVLASYHTRIGNRPNGRQTNKKD